MNQKLVSICIPTFNSSEYIEDTLKSIINQTYKNIEIIISDNNSTDDTYKIIQKYQNIDPRIRCFKNEINLGLFGNCNKLISLSRGEYIAIYHADDIYNSKIVEKEFDFLESNHDFLGVFSLDEKINDKGEVLRNIKPPIAGKNKIIEVKLNLFINLILTNGGSCFCCPTSMIRRSIYDKMGGYNDNFIYIGDQDMWARILLKGPMAILNEKLINYRIHKKQLSSKYLDDARHDMAIPLKHIKDFIQKHNLNDEFNDQVLMAEAKDLVYLAVIAVRRSDYPFFYQSIMQSKLKCGLDYKTREGFVQKFPYPRITYSLIKGLHIFRKFLK
jgi:glycosyltransferase involved in cell wall biosynthesis